VPTSLFPNSKLAQAGDWLQIRDTPPPPRVKGHQTQLRTSPVPPDGGSDRPFPFPRIRNSPCKYLHVLGCGLLREGDRPASQGWQIASFRLSDSDVAGGRGGGGEVWKKQLFTHARRTTNFGTWWLSLSASIYQVPGSHMIQVSCAHHLHQFTNCCYCWISPVGVNCAPPVWKTYHGDIHPRSSSSPPLPVANHDKVNAFILLISTLAATHQHGQRENGRGCG
jgi:hypothetical protein